MENADRLVGSRGASDSTAVQRLREEVGGSPVTYAIIVGGIALQLLFVLLHGVNSELLGDRSFLALDRDANLPAWTETLLFAVAGLGCWLLAWLEPAVRPPLALLGLVALLLSFEQMAQLHMRVEADLGSSATNVIEPLMALGLVAIVAFASRGLPWLSRVLLWAAIAAIALAQGSSMVNAELDLPHLEIVVFQTLEEVGEMLTATLLIAAVAQPIIDGVVARVLRASEAGRLP